MKYIRDTLGTCECMGLMDIEKVSPTERASLTEWWDNGYMYRNGTAKPCTCFKMFKSKASYDVLAKAKGLQSYEELISHKYIGETSKATYDKIMKLPSMLTDSKLPSSLTVYMYGGPDCQKTTTASKIILKAIARGCVVSYHTMGSIFGDLALNDDADERVKTTDDFKYADLLIIDDSFMSKPVSFYSVFDTFAEFLAARTKPTIFISQFSPAELNKAFINDQFYKQNVLHTIITRAKQTNSVFEFTDDVAKIMAAKSMTINGEIDIWS